MAIPYKDGSGNLRHRRISRGDGTIGNADETSNHDPQLMAAVQDVVGLQAATAAAAPTSTAALGQVVKGLWAWLQANLPDITDSFTLLNAVVTVSTGTSQICDRYSTFCFYWLASSVTSGGIVTVEAEAPDGSWHEIAREVIAVNTATTAIAPIIISPVGFRAVRGRVVSRVDGAFTIMMTARG